MSKKPKKTKFVLETDPDVEFPTIRVTGHKIVLVTATKQVAQDTGDGSFVKCGYAQPSKTMVREILKHRVVVGLDRGGRISEMKVFGLKAESKPVSPVAKDHAEEKSA